MGGEGEGEVTEAERMVRMKEAAEIVGVHPQTLRLWERRGLIESVRPPGTYRRYLVADLIRLRGGA